MSDNSKNKNTKNNNRNNVKVYTNNTKLTNAELNNMKKNTDSLWNFLKGSLRKNHQYATISSKNISDLPRSIQKLLKKYEDDKQRNYIATYLEVDTMKDVEFFESSTSFFSSVCCDSDDKFIIKFQKIKDQDIRMYKEPRKTITNKITDFFVGLMGGKARERKYKRIKEGDVIVSQGEMPLYIESENVGENAKIGVLYLISQMLNGKT